MALLPVVYSFIHYFSSKGNLLIFVYRDRDVDKYITRERDACRFGEFSAEI